MKSQIEQVEAVAGFLFDRYCTTHSIAPDNRAQVTINDYLTWLVPYMRETQIAGRPITWHTSLGIDIDEEIVNGFLTIGGRPQLLGLIGQIFPKLLLKGRVTSNVLVGVSLSMLYRWEDGVVRQQSIIVHRDVTPTGPLNDTDCVNLVYRHSGELVQVILEKGLDQMHDDPLNLQGVLDAGFLAEVRKTLCEHIPGGDLPKIVQLMDFLETLMPDEIPGAVRQKMLAAHSIGKAADLPRTDTGGFDA